MGSVKDLTVIKEPDQHTTGIGRFMFSDRYSVFDWGKMPDNIADRGKALCVMGAYFFERLAKMGIRTHYLGVVEDGEPRHLSQLRSPSNCMEFKLLRVINPQKKENLYDYSTYRGEEGNFLIPLEIIYRNSLPESSSLLKRLRNGEVKPEDIGLKSIPPPGEELKIPLLDVSTKLEATDRYITWDEAKEMTGFVEGEIKEIKRITLLVNEVVTKEAERIELFNEDGKVEFGFDEFRNIVVVDVVGTPDECRFTFGGIPMCKEIARAFYRKTHWYKEIVVAKKKNRLNWKETVDVSPPLLPHRLTELISMVYRGIANEITQRVWFKNTPALKDLVYDIGNFIS